MLVKNRYLKSRDRVGWHPLIRAVVLQSIGLNGLLWTGGFAVLTASALPPNRYLGILSSLVVALSTLFTLGLLPVFALVLKRRSTGPARPLELGGTP